MIIFHVAYPFFICYYCLLFSDFIDTKYIIIGLSLVEMEIISVLINIVAKKFKNLYICLSALISSLIGLISFSSFWIKSLYPIIYVAIYWLLSNGYYTIWIYGLNKLYKLEEYFYSVIIFNYSIFLGLVYAILYLAEYICSYLKNRFIDDNIELMRKRDFYLNNFIILFIQIAVIITLTVIGFEYQFNEILIKADYSLEIKYIPILVFIFLLMFIFYACLFDYKISKITIIFHIFFPPFICYCSFMLSEYLDSKYIIIGLSLIGIEILSILINIFAKKYEILYISLSAVILSLIGLIFFSVFWIKSLYPIIFVSIFWIVSNGCYTLLIFITNKKCELYEYFYSAIIFNYSIFFGLAYIIVESAKYIKNRFNDNDNDNELQSIKKFYFMNFLILFIQFAIIILLTIIGFVFKFNEILIQSEASLAVKYTPFICFMFLLALIFCGFSLGHEKNKCLINFFIFFPPFVCYYSFLLSEYIDPKYCIIGLSLVGMEILSLSINIILKKFDILFICLSAVVLSLIGLIFFSAFWIKSLYPIIYVSIFWLISNGLYTLFIFVTKVLCESDEYFYSVVIFNYNIFLGIASIIKLMFKYISEYISVDCRCEYDKEFCRLFKTFGILLGQYIVIIIFVWVGFVFEWNSTIKNSAGAAFGFGFFTTIVNVVINSFFISYIEDPENGVGWIFSIIIYVPIMIIYYYCFSYSIEEKYILAFLFILFFELLFIFLFMLFTSSNHFAGIAISAIISNILTLILFHFYWLQNTTAVTWLSILSILSNIYFNVIAYFADEQYQDVFIFSVMALDYGAFSACCYVIYKLYKALKSECRNL